jgi:hypothetical protein
MTAKICILGDTLAYPEGGGHFWVYLNWALGFQQNGCEVVWMESARPASPHFAAQLATLRARLQRYNFTSIALLSGKGENPEARLAPNTSTLAEAAMDADLLVNFRYGADPRVVERFRRSALMDIDPGLLQVWISEKSVNVAPHDVYFTIGETVGSANAAFPDCGIEWSYVRPSVALSHWPVQPSQDSSAFTTVSNWYSGEWITHAGRPHPNNKRAGFEPFLPLPARTGQMLELALCLAPEEVEERERLTSFGWRLRRAEEVAGTPELYRQYVGASRGEFSCAKPSCVLLQNAWVSDRTLCYLASGKPAVVQHTGRSRYLPDDEGIFRFQNEREALRGLEAAAGDYSRHSSAARSLAETYFDARTNAAGILERAGV